ncbi:hypothetical protein [Streptomyces sp. ISID311]|uniref:hypothetical protein n=1 Tax=Streptomyces sp. ISID311 TaxID=2601673 RepID=UPI0011BD3E32|nr:hypothetical protein [Streptomyces sp. ISID311]TXC97729.1 hypothetical protein FS847_09990 [Streptomyces sp. ISID311]
MPPVKKYPSTASAIFSHTGRKPRGDKAYEAISGKHRKGGPAPFPAIRQITADGIIYGDFSELNTATTPDD